MSNESSEEAVIRIEQTQAALRASIAEATELAAQSERLVRKHRGTIAKPPNPAS